MNDIVWTFMILMFVLIIIINLYMFYQKGLFGEQYKFNMTKDLEDEGRILQLCIYDTKMKLPDVETFCSTRYGGIDTNYGEAIK